MTAISFPGIGFTWDPLPSFDIGPLEIHWYGVLIALGMMLAVLYACGRCKEFGLKEDDLIDGVLCIVPFAVLCARLYYCIFQWDTYASNPIRILYIWEGGLAIYGGVIGAAIGIVVFSFVKKNKVNLLAVLDITSLGFLIGQAMGRWGNFFNGEAHGGIVAESSPLYFLRMGLDPNELVRGMAYVHPTFLYESLWNVLGFVLINVFVYKRKKFNGQIFLTYAAWYGFGRMFIEGLRTDSLYLGGGNSGIRVSQLVAAICFVGGTALIGYMLWRCKKQEASGEYVPVFAPVQIESEGEASEGEDASQPSEQEQKETEDDGNSD